MTRSNLTRLLSRTVSCIKCQKTTWTSSQVLPKRFVHYSFPISKSTCHILQNTENYNIFQERTFRLSLNLYNEEKDVFAPAFPESVPEGDIRWNKNAGDAVKVDEVVCEIETDKTAIPVPSPGNGVISQVFAEDGSTVKSGQKLFKIKLGASAAAPSKKPSTTSEKIQSPPHKQDPTKEPKKVPHQQKIVPTQAPGPPPKMPQSLQGAFLKLPPQEPTKEITGLRSEYKVKMSRMRQRIAQRLKEAQNTCAMLTTFNEIDMTYIMAFRKSNQDAFTKKYGIKLGFMSAFLKASVYALQDQPVVNAVIVNNEIIYRDYIDISVAVASPKGLLVPVIRNVDKMNYADIEKAINILGIKAKKGEISIEDMDGGTFTVSNGGVFGSLMGTPIINPPQSAILGMHGVFERPVAINNQVVIRPMMYLALTYDHRLIDGREAVLFLRKIKAGVENPTIILAGL